MPQRESKILIRAVRVVAVMIKVVGRHPGPWNSWRDWRRSHHPVQWTPCQVCEGRGPHAGVIAVRLNPGKVAAVYCPGCLGIGEMPPPAAMSEGPVFDPEGR